MELLVFDNNIWNHLTLKANVPWHIKKCYLQIICFIGFGMRVDMP